VFRSGVNKDSDILEYGAVSIGKNINNFEDSLPQFLGSKTINALNARGTNTSELS